MIIIPSLDIQNGKSRYAFEGTYDPLVIVRTLKQKGFHHFMLTDLDGVFSGEFVNYDLVQQLKQEEVYLYVGGGIRSSAIAQKIVEAGADQMVIGTIAIKDQELLMDLINDYREQLSVAIDTYDNSVFIEGWVEDSDVDIDEFISSMSLLGVRHLIHTEINNHNNVLICANDVMKALAIQHDISITPSIDITEPASIKDLIDCGCQEIMIGGYIDRLDLDHYKVYHV